MSPRLRFRLMLVGLFGTLAAGLWAYLRQMRLGDVTTGLGTVGHGGIAWGLYIAMDGFFLSTGFALMTIACVARFSRNPDAETFARIAMPIAVTSFLVAGLTVLVDQGRPLWALFHLSRYANPRSPLFFTFTLLGAIGLYGSLLHCVLARRPDLAVYATRPSFWQPLQRLLCMGYRGTFAERWRRRVVSQAMSVGLLLPLCAILCALSVVFAIRPARPLVPTLLEFGSFGVLALAGGLGMLANAAWLVDRVSGQGPRQEGYSRLGRVLLLLAALSFYFVVAKTLASVLSSSIALRRYGQALVSGPGSPLFWVELGLFFLATLVLFHSLWRRQFGPGKVVLCGLMLQVGVFLDRYLTLVVWQTHGHSLPYPAGVYTPTWNELLVALGIVSLAFLLLLPSVRLIPFAPIANEKSLPAGLPMKSERYRRVITVLWAVVSVLICLLGFFSAARVGTLPTLDPVLSASPLIFALGLAMLTTTGAVYECLPAKN